METIASISGSVYHMEEDRTFSGSILFSNYVGLSSLSLTSWPPPVRTIAGREGEMGYREGIGKLLLNLLLMGDNSGVQSLVTRTPWDGCITQWEDHYGVVG